MKAIIFLGVGKVEQRDMPMPRIEAPTDAIVRITTSAICGTDLHMLRGTMTDMIPGTILGHEGVGIVEELGHGVRNLSVGDRVVIPSTIACGNCAYCRDGYYAQCDVANPNGKRAGTAFFGGPKSAGPFHGLQAEFARVPFANVGLVRLPDEVPDDQAVLLSDILPTAYFGAELAGMHPGATVAVFGCGPVGLLTIASLNLMDAGRIIAVDCEPTRLELAREQGAETVNFEEEDPVAKILDLTDGIGVDRAIDAVGVDANRAHRGPAAQSTANEDARRQHEIEQVAPEHTASAGDAPSQALDWAVASVAKAGRIAIIGVYPQAARHFPIGEAMAKNLIIRMGNCNHRRYIPMLLRHLENKHLEPAKLLPVTASFSDALLAYRAFDQHDAGWIKVALATAPHKHAKHG